MHSCAYNIFMKKTTSKKREQITEELVQALDSKFFKALSEPVRIQILKFLILHGRSDIATIAEAFPQDRSVVSRHLQQMEEVGILKMEKETRYRFYEIDPFFFLQKLETITAQIRDCIDICCSEN